MYMYAFGDMQLYEYPLTFFVGAPDGESLIHMLQNEVESIQIKHNIISETQFCVTL